MDREPEFQENAVANVFEKTFDNRDLGADRLDRVTLTLYPKPRPGEVTLEVRKKGEFKEMDAFRLYQGDPFILFSDPMEVPVGGKLAYVNGAPLFTQNAKMASISFGTPAGPSDVGGACPASALPDSYDKHYELGDVDDRPMKYDEQICRKCYANKGNFMYELQQLYQLARFRWMKQELARNVRGLAKMMTDAVRTAAANYKKRHRDHEDPRFVRVHDSGDIFRPEVWYVWKFVAKSLPELNFWLPTRMWMLPAYVKLFTTPDEDGVAVPENMALRPSAYHFNERAPRVPGCADGTTSHYWEKKLKVHPIDDGIADWWCPAYEVGGKSCAGALERVEKVWTGSNRKALQKLKASMATEELKLTSGGRDCRVCWLRGNMRVSYKAH